VTSIGFKNEVYEMARKRRSSAKKVYRLRKGTKEIAVFTGRSPRQAALKAATRGHTDIRLRERGRRNKDRTYSIHVFQGGRKRVTIPEDQRVDWLPAQVWKPTVKKVRVERVRSLRMGK
jgi:hypothetical protein